MVFDAFDEVTCCKPLAWSQIKQNHKVFKELVMLAWQVVSIEF